MNISLLTNELVLAAVVLLFALFFIIQMFVIAGLKRRIAAIPQVQASTLFETELESFKENLSLFSKNQQVLTSSVSKLSTESKGIKKTSLIRYNPFRDSGVGGLQSFSSAIIDDNGNGVVISNLFSREMTRVSAKAIKEWMPIDQELSPEEKQAIEETKQ